MTGRRSRTGVCCLTISILAISACGSSGSGKSAPTPVPTSAAAKTALPVKPADVASRPSAGCQATVVAPGQSTLNLSAGGDKGIYIRHLPPSYDGRQPMPLILDLHGWSEGASIHTLVSGLGAFGDSHGFITLTPQIDGPVPHWSTDLNGKDVAFIGGLLDTAERTLCIDQARIFSTGYSDGAIMTSAIACKYSDRIAAAAPVAGIRTTPGCTFSRPVPVVAFHGTADPYVPYDGGVGKSTLNLPAPDGSGKTLGQEGLKSVKGENSIPQATAAWAARNGCGDKPTSRTVATGITLISYPCPADATVELYRVAGGGHAWPGSTVDKRLEKVIGPVTLAISADAIMWAFFQDHPLPAN